jgi:hypothetical protein
MLWIWSFQDDPSAFLAEVLICKSTALLCAPSFLNPLKVNVLDRAPCEVR